jgi:hypothetical protein
MKVKSIFLYLHIPEYVLDSKAMEFTASLGAGILYWIFFFFTSRSSNYTEARYPQNRPRPAEIHLPAWACFCNVS